MKTIKMVCPNLDCKNHIESISDEHNWYSRFSFFYSQRLKKKIQRFRCKNCGKTFSTQTFSVDYWVKITVDYKHIEELNRKCDTIRDMERKCGLSNCVIRNRLERLSRQYTAIDWRHERKSTEKPVQSELEGLYGVGSAAERYIINNLGRYYRAPEQQRMLKYRFFITHMDLDGLMRLIWFQRYKSGTVFIPQFIAG